MRLIIEARLEGGETSETEATTVAVVERKDRSVADLGLTLAEGRALLAEVQSLLVSEQTAGWMESQLACDRCGSMLAHKDARSIVVESEPNHGRSIHARSARLLQKSWSTRQVS